MAVMNGKLAVLQWLLAEGGASISDDRIWLVLPSDEEQAIGLIRTLLLHQGPPESVSAGGWDDDLTLFLCQYVCNKLTGHHSRVLC